MSGAPNSSWGFPADRLTPEEPAEEDAPTQAPDGDIESDSGRRRGRRGRDTSVPATPSDPEPALDTPASDDNS